MYHGLWDFPRYVGQGVASDEFLLKRFRGLEEDASVSGLEN
jgi:hypothetical protein